MLKASRDAVPEGKPLDPTLLQDGFLRVCGNLTVKNIDMFKSINPKTPELYIFCIYTFVLL